MKASDQVLKRIRVGSLLGFLGFIVFLFSFVIGGAAERLKFSADIIVLIENFSNLCLFIGIIFLWVGIIMIFRAKGYKGFWGYLLCLIAPFGWLIVLGLSDKQLSPETPEPRKSRILLWASLIILGIIPIIFYFNTLPQITPEESQSLETTYRWFVEIGGHVGQSNDIREFKALTGYYPELRRAMDYYNYKTNRADTEFDTRHINLSGTEIDNASLSRLKILKYLRRIDLSNTKISDEGLIHLYDMKVLRHINLANTRVNDAAIDKLKHALPSCAIER